MDLRSSISQFPVKSNSVLTGGMSPPQIVNVVDNHGIVIRHREYIQDISATTAFTSTVLPIQPGMVETFPWLAQIAGSFEEYQFKGLLFEFKSLSSDAVLSSATSSALGAVIMATQYNAINPPFQNKQQMENYEFACSAKPSITFYHPIECAPSQTFSQGKLFTRVIAQPANTDLRLYDMGNFQISTVGMQAASGVCGELWCTYEIQFWKPRFNQITEGGQAGVADHWMASTGVTGTNCLGSTGSFSSGSTLGGLVQLNGGMAGFGSIYLFPPNLVAGQFHCMAVWKGTGASTIAQPGITVSGGVLGPVKYFVNNASFISVPQGVSSATAILSFYVTVTVTGCVITLDNTATIPTTCGVDWTVEEVDSTFN